MHIQKIEISNVLGLARADLTLSTPVTVITGNNEAGKSTLADAISMAILGTPRRVKLKKELGQLLHDGAKKGRVTIVGGGEALGEYRLPGGEHVVADDIKGKAFLEFVLDPAAFARQTEQERRSTLFALTSCKMSPDVVEKKLIERGAATDLAAEVKPLLRSGFPSACKQAKDNATAAKGAWRATTGQNWGAVAAEGWALEVPTGPAITEEQIIKAKAELHKTANDIENGLSFVGKLQGQLQAFASYDQRTNDLTEAAGLLDRAQTKLSVDQKDLAKWEDKLATGKADLAAAQAGSTGCDCPSCGTTLKIVGNVLELFTGAAADPAKAKTISVEVTTAYDTVTMLRRTVGNDQQAVAIAEQATKDLAAHLEAKPEAASQQKIDDCHTKITELRLQRDKQQAKVDALTERQNLLSGQQKTNEDAAKYHAEVKDWQLIADALAPDGIPGEILATAMTPVNDSLALLAGMAKWKAVQVSTDMDITIDGRAYGLCSESSKWRADTLIALAIAQISGLRLVVLDRFDVLDLPGRAQLVGMLVQLSKVGAMDTMIMCGTMKALPKGLPPEVTAVWCDRGIAETDPQ